jgi:hypothetical protein
MTFSDIAQRHGFSEAAAQSMLASIRSGGGSMAQFSHPEFGGMGQWSRGGMIMIGDMFNNGLKARVDALCNDLAAYLQDEPAQAQTAHSPSGFGGGSHDGNWWPGDLGAPASSGSQNGMRYAYFPATHCVAVEQNGRVSLYDAGEHRIGGVSQQQSGVQSLAFTSQLGTIRVEDLRHIGSSQIPTGR